MKEISVTEFFRRIKGAPTAKVGATAHQGMMCVSDDYVVELLAKTEQLTFRKVSKVQSNAFMFEDNSWIWFAKPRNCDSRNAYSHTIDGLSFVSLVDHRPAYENSFGTQISERTTILVYQLAV